MSPALKLMNQDTLLQSAKRYLADKAYDYLIGKPQTAKLGQVLKDSGINKINMRLVRDVLQESSKFECVDRRWTTSVRFGESGRPFERVVGNIMDSYGRTVGLETLASELGQIFKRPKEIYEEQLVRFLKNKDKFFQANDGKYGLAKWLVGIPSSDDEEDVLFDNFLEKSDVEYYKSKCNSLKWSADNYADTVNKAVKNCGEPIPGKILAFMAWDELREDFDSVDLYSSIAEDSNLVVMSDLKVYSADLVKSFEAELVKLAEQLADLPMEADEEEADGPVSVTDTDKEEIVSIIKSKGSASAEELLEAVLEVSPNESAFAGALESLKEVLANDDRVMWVGGTRWSKIIEFPEEVLSLPESLIIPSSMSYETPEGDIFDQMLEEEGFEADLKSIIYDPLAEDITDEDPSRTDYQPDQEKQKCVLKYHHKFEGTFPLCQINPEFFGTQPEIIPITVIEESVRKIVYVNNATRLIYGLKDFYKNITDVSGAVFYFEKTAKAGEFRFVYNGESDDQICIDTNKSLELVDLKSTFESTEMPVYDVVTDILEKKQGITFVHLLTQVNIVKRCSRLLIASILSSYHCFSTRGKSGLWQYDDKKRSQGFNKSKRKYIKK